MMKQPSHPPSTCLVPLVLVGLGLSCVVTPMIVTGGLVIALCLGAVSTSFVLHRIHHEAKTAFRDAPGPWYGMSLAAWGAAWITGIAIALAFLSSL
jgi:hypothetical protein